MTPSETAICRSPRLAELDNTLAAGYAFIKTNQGRAAADAIGIPYWKAISQCEGVEECIAKRQSEESLWPAQERQFHFLHGSPAPQTLHNRNRRPLRH